MERAVRDRLLGDFREKLVAAGMAPAAKTKYIRYLREALRRMRDVNDARGLERAYFVLESDAQRATLRDVWSLLRDATAFELPSLPGSLQREGLPWRELLDRFVESAPADRSRTTFDTYRRLVSPALRGMGSLRDEEGLLRYYEGETLPGSRWRTRFRCAWRAFSAFCIAEGHTGVAELPEAVRGRRAKSALLVPACELPFKQFKVAEERYLSGVSVDTARIYTAAVRYALSKMQDPADAPALRHVIKTAGSLSSVLPAAWKRFAAFCRDRTYAVAELPVREGASQPTTVSPPAPAPSATAVAQPLPVATARLDAAPGPVKKRDWREIAARSARAGTHPRPDSVPGVGATVAPASNVVASGSNRSLLDRIRGRTAQSRHSTPSGTVAAAELVGAEVSPKAFIGGGCPTAALAPSPSKPAWEYCECEEERGTAQNWANNSKNFPHHLHWPARLGGCGRPLQ